MCGAITRNPRSGGPGRRPRRCAATANCCASAWSARGIDQTHEIFRMLNPLTASTYLLRPLVVQTIGLLADEPRSKVDPLGCLAEAAALVAKSRAALKKQDERLEKFYRQAER